ncbi:MAG TPA: hypothetical protein VFE05_09680 [Longimicrobiaceae bacterium]|nr:hypothetical protein [Longimicrobiaceae bacterium]
MTAAQRATGASLLFLAAAVLAGFTLADAGVEYRTFGLVEGLFALLLTYVLVHRRAWELRHTLVAWIAVAYGTIANAQLLALLFPPPGLVQWVVVAGLAITAWAALGRGTSHRLMVSLGSLALVLAVLKFSVIPALWRQGPAAGTGFGLGDLAETGRRIFADYHPVRHGSELIGFVALCCWVLATRLLWPSREPALPRTSPHESGAAIPPS